jgi:hypothetical protein
MPDTGAPWNIPYADPTDLVRDWPALSEDVAEAVADGFDAVALAGIGSNLVVGSTTTTTTTTSTSYVNTSLTATITPTTNTSKVLVIASAAQFSHSNGAGVSFARLYRGTVTGTALDTTAQFYFNSNVQKFTPLMIMAVDSPGTAGAQAYTLAIRTNNATNTTTVEQEQYMVLIEVRA